MPTVLRVEGFVFSFYSNDHEPPHVHVRYAGSRVVIEIVSERIRDVAGLSDADVAYARRLVRAHCAELLAAWDTVHLQKEP
jgi:hypothetical protein